MIAKINKPAALPVKGIAIGTVLAVFLSIAFIPLDAGYSNSYGLKTDRLAPDFKLTNVKGKTVSLSDFQGKYLFLMFGYLNCDDICHDQALTFQEINHHADNPNDLHFVYIAMDPERDSASRLAAYFDGRASNFTSLRSHSQRALQSLASDYKAFFSVQNKNNAGDYEISHNGLFYLIGPDGHLEFLYGAKQKSIPLILGDLLELKERNTYLE